MLIISDKFKKKLSKVFRDREALSELNFLVSDDERIENIKIVFKVGNKFKSVNYNTFFNLKISQDISNLVTRNSETGHPVQESLYQFRETLARKGFQPGDEEWEKMGIAEHVTWPRTVCSIEGHDVNGKPLSDTYLTTETKTIEKPRNIKQIKYVSDISELKVADVKQLVSMLSNGILPMTLVLPDTKFVVSDDPSHTSAVLIDDNADDSFLEALDGMDHITDLFIITKNNKLFKQLKGSIT